MKRDMDFVRELLLKTEQNDPRNLRDLLAPDADDADYDRLALHMGMLIDEAGLVRGIEAHTLSDRNWLDIRLTWQGHDYLDSIRDPEIWDKTKKGAAAAGGFTLEILGALAKGLIKQKIKQHTGVELEF